MQVNSEMSKTCYFVSFALTQFMDKLKRTNKWNTSLDETVNVHLESSSTYRVASSMLFSDEKKCNKPEFNACARACGSNKVELALLTVD